MKNFSPIFLQSLLASFLSLFYAFFFPFSLLFETSTLVFDIDIQFVKAEKHSSRSTWQS